MDLKLPYIITLWAFSMVGCSDRSVSSDDVEGAGRSGIPCGENVCGVGSACVACPVDSGGSEFDCFDTDENGNTIGSDCGANAVVASCDGPEDCDALEVCAVFYAANSTIAKCQVRDDDAEQEADAEDCVEPGARACHQDEDCLCGACAVEEGPLLSTCVRP